MYLRVHEQITPFFLFAWQFWISIPPTLQTCHQLSSPLNSISTKQNLYTKCTLRCKTIQVHITVASTHDKSIKTGLATLTDTIA